MRSLAVLTTITGLLAASPAPAQDSAAAGEHVFRFCRNCHGLGPDAVNMTGPVLTGVVGRHAGTYPEYAYSPAMLEAGTAGLVWTEETLTQFLADPRGMLPGIKMSFRGLSNPADIANLITYLAGLSTNLPAE